jgi:hypothetical protein
MVRSDEWMLIGGILPITHRPPKYKLQFICHAQRQLLQHLPKRAWTKGVRCRREMMELP